MCRNRPRSKRTPNNTGIGFSSRIAPDFGISWIQWGRINQKSFCRLPAVLSGYETATSVEAPVLSVTWMTSPSSWADVMSPEPETMAPSMVVM